MLSNCMLFCGLFCPCTLVPLQRGRGGRRHRTSCQVSEKARQSVGSLEPRRKTAKLAVPSPNQTKPNQTLIQLLPNAF